MPDDRSSRWFVLPRATSYEVDTSSSLSGQLCGNDAAQLPT
ncbi:Protein of unknown function [Propionibacterium freudenreichii subsp. freudenreichii]|nr:Protein of unknown function [Propionibacterium freudenreichii subsp. freudenreichii]